MSPLGETNATSSTRYYSTIWERLHLVHYCVNQDNIKLTACHRHRSVSFVILVHSCRYFSNRHCWKRVFFHQTRNCFAHFLVSL